MPKTERDICDFIFGLPANTVAVIERVHAMPGNGASSMFTFGRSYGSARMALIAASVSFEESDPRTWQKALGIPPRRKSQGETPRAFKNRLRAHAQQLFPSEKITLAVADALLLSEYCRRKHEGTF
jgi:hypothetical protein